MSKKNTEIPVWGAEKIGKLVGVSGQVIRNWVREDREEANYIYETETRRLYVFPTEFVESFRKGVEE